MLNLVTMAKITVQLIFITLAVLLLVRTFPVLSIMWFSTKAFHFLFQESSVATYVSLT